MKKNKFSKKIKRIVIPTIKISLGAILAILIATALHLEFAVSAGIVAILSIQPTKRETLKTASGRFFAFLVALILAYISFLLFGFNTTGFLVYLVFFIFVCQYLNFQSAMAMDSVLISHFLSFKAMTPNSIINEILLFLIGVGIGILLNLTLHSKEEYMESLKKETDQQIQNILLRMSERIINQDLENYDGNCFTSLRSTIRKAANQAEENYQNTLYDVDVYDLQYISMRQEQMEVLYEMYKEVRHVKTTPATAKILSDFFQKVSLEYHESNNVSELLQELEEVKQHMKLQELPQNRLEFEDRAKLFALMNRLEEFLFIKNDFMKKTF